MEEEIMSKKYLLAILGVSIRFLLYIILAQELLKPFHEFGHYSAYLIAGVEPRYIQWHWGQINVNDPVILDDLDDHAGLIALAALMGPLFEYFTVTLALFALIRRRPSLIIQKWGREVYLAVLVFGTFGLFHLTYEMTYSLAGLLDPVHDFEIVKVFSPSLYWGVEFIFYPAVIVTWILLVKKTMFSEYSLVLEWLLLPRRESPLFMVSESEIGDPQLS